MFQKALKAAGDAFEYAKKFGAREFFVWLLFAIVTCAIVENPDHSESARVHFVYAFAAVTSTFIVARSWTKKNGKM